MFKPNYRLERAERRRNQQSKQEKKLQEQRDAVALRRASKVAAEPIRNENEADAAEDK